MNRASLGLFVAFAFAVCCTPVATTESAAPEGRSPAAASAGEGDPAAAKAEVGTPESTSDDAHEGSAEPQPRMAGGYTDVATDRDDVVQTAARAVALLQTKTGDGSLALKRIEAAATQVVAGRNTKLALVLDSAAGERTATVVVYRDLKGNESLTEVVGL